MNPTLETAVETGARHTVTLVDGALRISNWETLDPEIVSYFEDGEQRGSAAEYGLPALFEQVIKTGIAALRAAGVSVNVDYIQKEFQRFAFQIDRTLASRILEIQEALNGIFAEGGSLPQSLAGYLGQDGRLDELFDPNLKDSAVSKIGEILAEHFNGENSKFYKLLDVTSSGSPLRKWKEDLQKDLEALRLSVERYRIEMSEELAAEKGRDEIREKTALKGIDYQASVFEAINSISNVFGDSAELIADQPGLGGSKVGDIVVVINQRDTKRAGVRIVIEAKDRPVGLTAILREIDDARQNRDALTGIAVYSRPELMPTGAAPFREQGEGRYLCLYDKCTVDDVLALQLAYRFARFWAIHGVTSHRGEIDGGGILQDLEEARVQLNAISTIKGQITKFRSSIEAGLEKLGEDLDRFRKAMAGILGRIDERLRPDAKSVS